MLHARRSLCVCVGGGVCGGCRCVCVVCICRRCSIGFTFFRNYEICMCSKNIYKMVYSRAHVLVCIHQCMYVCNRILYMHVYTHDMYIIRKCLSVWIYIYMHVYICGYIYTCMYTHVNKYSYRHPHTARRWWHPNAAARRRWHAWWWGLLLRRKPALCEYVSV